MTTDTYTIEFLEKGQLRGWYLIIRMPGTRNDGWMQKPVSAKYKISRPQLAGDQRDSVILRIAGISDRLGLQQDKGVRSSNRQPPRSAVV